MNHHVDPNLVRVNRVDLLGALKTNRKKHVEEYAIAITEFRKDVAAEYRSLADMIEADGKLRMSLRVNTNPPQSHEEEFTRTIAKFEFSVDDTILLNDIQFNSFVLNQWAWAGNLSNSYYATKALS